MAGPIDLSELAVTVGLGRHELVTIVGGGGKTTTLLALGHQLTGTRVLTTTTKMGRDRTGGFRVLVAPTDDELRVALGPDDVVIAWRADAGHKAIGVAPERCDAWFDLANHVVVEADGASRHPFKAPRPFEPVVPSRTTTLLACIGADALGRVIADQCHRPMRVAAVAGCGPYERLTPERASRVLLDRRGSRKGCPDDARFVVMIHKVDERSAALAVELEQAIAGEAPVVQVAFRV